MDNILHYIIFCVKKKIIKKKLDIKNQRCILPTKQKPQAGQQPWGKRVEEPPLGRKSGASGIRPRNRSERAGKLKILKPPYHRMVQWMGGSYEKGPNQQDIN
jgi:hypothetical protein